MHQSTTRVSKLPTEERGLPADDGEKVLEDELTYPDGGLHAWLVVVGSWCAMVCAFGIWNSVGVLQAWLATHQLAEYSEGNISWIFSVFSFLFFFCGVQIGPLFDRYGLKPLVLPGSVGFVASLMLFSVSKKYYQFMLSFGVLGGISGSFIFTPAIACINQWFNTHRGLAIGVATTGGGIGGVVFPLVVRSLIYKVGFGWTMRIVGFICLLTLILAVLCMKTRFPENKKRNGTIDLSAFKDRRFLATAAAAFMLEWALQIPQIYFTSFALYKGVDETLAYQLTAVLNGASVFGRWLPGYFADRVGRYNMMIVTIGMCGVFVLSLWIGADDVDGQNLELMIAYLVVFGFASGTGISLTPVCVSQITDIREYGTRYGTMFSFASVGTLTGVPIAGAIMRSQNGQYDGLIVYCGLCYVVAMIFFVFARGFSAGWKIRIVF
ncbi:major facilitator superfamily domain-containing protein [Lipomyces arxii]|uniref:major facilitator superfamily domain-containing protein n=1 Tax=Lipomyces arxii TaxID=56418 RepID=UPI0034CD40E1